MKTILTFVVITAITAVILINNIRHNSKKVNSEISI